MKRRLAVAVACASAVIAAIGGGGSASAARPIERVAIPEANLMLPALIARPTGSQRFPAVVLLHGCSGMWSAKNPAEPQSHVKRWLTMLQQRGYVAMAIDSFGSRGIKSACGRAASRTGAAQTGRRVADAFAALSYLRSLSYVSPQRVAVLGWSDGGSTALAAVGAHPPAAPPAAGNFRTAVAFYPGCGQRGVFKRYRPTVPTLLLTASHDPQAPACRSLARRAGKRLRVTVYRGAHHSFDEATAHARSDRAARKRADNAALQGVTQALAASNARTIFSPDSWITAPLVPGAPLDANQSYAAALRSQVAQYGTWVNTTSWSSPVYVVGPDQPRVDVAIDTAHARYSARDIGYLTDDFRSVPLPDDAQPAGPQESLTTTGWVDHELILYQPSSDTAWEFYHLVHGSHGWTATGGGRISHVSESNGDYDPWPSGTPHGMTGSGIPMLAGLQRVDELQRGVIDHEVGISIPHVLKDVVRGPATRTDGEFTTPDAIPEGTRFRLPASLDIDSLPLTPYAKIVAKAIQAHGLVVVDRDCRPSDRKCPAVTFKAEDPRPLPDQSHGNPYAGIFAGVAANHLFDNFPWEQLQVLSED